MEMSLKIREYKKNKYDNWASETQCILPGLMRKHLLAEVTAEEEEQVFITEIATLF